MYSSTASHFRSILNLILVLYVQYVHFHSLAGILHAEGETWKRSRKAAMSMLNHVLRSGGIADRVTEEEAVALANSLAVLSQQYPTGFDPKYAC